MPYKYHESINIYDKDAIARTVQSMETQFTVVNGKISSLITDSELNTLRNGGSTMYSRMYTMEQTVDGLSSTVSSMQTSLQNNYPTKTEMTSAITQKANEITLAVSQTLTNYSTTQQMSSAIQQSATNITQTVSSTYYTKADGQNLEGRVTTAESKITDSAIVTTVTSSQGFNQSVSSIIEQSASSIRLQASRISWTSDNSSMTAAGVLSCTGATISGDITAETGQIGPWHITSTAIYKVNASWGNSSTGAAYFGNDGISITDKFKVSAAGAMASTSGSIGNWSIDPTKGLKNLNGSVFLSSSSTSASVPDKDQAGKTDEVAVLARFGSVYIQDNLLYSPTANTNMVHTHYVDMCPAIPADATVAEILDLISKTATLQVEANSVLLGSSYNGYSAALQATNCDVLLESTGSIRIKKGTTIYDLINSCWRANKINITSHTGYADDGAVSLWGPESHISMTKTTNINGEVTVGDIYVTDSYDSSRSFSLLNQTFRRHVVNEGESYPVINGRLYVAFFYHQSSVKSSGIFIFVGGKTTAQPILMGSGSGAYNGNIYIELTTTTFKWSDNNNNPTCYLYY